MNTDFLTTAFKRLRSRLHLDDDSGVADDDIADALQDAFCRLWARKAVAEGEAHAEGMLATTLRNIRADVVRRRSRHPETGLEALEDATLMADSCGEDFRELYKRVDRLAAESLSVRDREILFHRERDGWDFGELALHYGLSEANVRMIVSRGRKTVRDIYLRKKGNYYE